jgi:hypothetical protein
MAWMERGLEAALKNARRERFSQELANGATADAAN